MFRSSKEICVSCSRCAGNMQTSNCPCLWLHWCGFVWEWDWSPMEDRTQCSNPIWLLDWIIYGRTQVIIRSRPTKLNRLASPKHELVVCMVSRYVAKHCRIPRCTAWGFMERPHHRSLVTGRESLAYPWVVDGVWWGQFLAEWLVNFVAPSHHSHHCHHPRSPDRLTRRQGMTEG